MCYSTLIPKENDNSWMKFDNNIFIDQNYQWDQSDGFKNTKIGIDSRKILFALKWYAISL